MKTLQEKYENDPRFHALVETIEHLIRDHQLTMADLFEAIILACIRVELKFMWRAPETLRTNSSTSGSSPDVPKPKGPILQKTHT